MLRNGDGVRRANSFNFAPAPSEPYITSLSTCWVKTGVEDSDLPHLHALMGNCSFLNSFLAPRLVFLLPLLPIFNQIYFVVLVLFLPFSPQCFVVPSGSLLTSLDPLPVDLPCQVRSRGRQAYRLPATSLSPKNPNTNECHDLSHLVQPLPSCLRGQTHVRGNQEQRASRLYNVRKGKEPLRAWPGCQHLREVNSLPHFFCDLSLCLLSCSLALLLTQSFLTSQMPPPQ